MFGVATTQAPSSFYSNAVFSMKKRGAKYVSLSAKVNSIALVNHEIWATIILRNSIMNASRLCSVLNTFETQHLPVFDSSPDYERADLARGLNRRHMQMIAIGAIAIIGTLIPFTDPNLLRSTESDIAYSPFTLVFDRLGVAAAAAVMNAVILTSILSAGNSGLYASSRMLHSVALIGQAPPRFLSRDEEGSPAQCDARYCRCFCSWLLHGAGWRGNGIHLVGEYRRRLGNLYVAWYRGVPYSFPSRLPAPGYRLEDLPYRAPFFPFGAILAFGMCLIVLLGQNYEAIFLGQMWEIISAYIGVPLFLGVWLGYHLIKKDRMTPLAELGVRGVTCEQVKEDIARTKHYDD